MNTTTPMSDDNSQHSDKYNKKGFFSILLSQIFQDEPKNKEDLIQSIRNFEKNKLIDKETRNMLERVIDITKYKVKDIMVPRPRMITLQSTSTFKNCLEIIIKSAHSRFPVMSKDENYVEGILIAKDLLPFMHIQKNTFHIQKILRPIIVAPESKYVNRMLKEFRLQKSHMAIVIDEFGAVSGLITIEDILELIVGKIEDEYDIDERNIHQINPLNFLIKSLTSLKEFNDYFHTTFNDIEVDTIGGLIIKKIGHLPIQGENISINNYKFKIHIANNRRIILLQLTIINDKNLNNYLLN